MFACATCFTYFHNAFTNTHTHTHTLLGGKIRNNVNERDIFWIRYAISYNINNKIKNYIISNALRSLQYLHERVDMNFRRTNTTEVHLNNGNVGENQKSQYSI